MGGRRRARVERIHEVEDAFECLGVVVIPHCELILQVAVHRFEPSKVGAPPHCRSKKVLLGLELHLQLLVIHSSGNNESIPSGKSLKFIIDKTWSDPNCVVPAKSLDCVERSDL